MPKKTPKKRTIAQIRADKSGKRTREEVRRLDDANTQKSKLYRSIMFPKRKVEKTKYGTVE